jgi:predicted TIM-barrel fold metal-dependent hydrolase
MIRIDSDTHFTPLDAFAGLDPMYAAQGPRVVELRSGRLRIDYPARAPFVPAHIKPLRVNGRPKSDFEIEPRLAAMAQDGFDMQVLIPNNSPFYYDVDAAMGASVSRAYNRAISRILKKYPGKFIGIAATPMQNVPLAIAEAEFAIKDLGLHSVIIYQNVNGKDLDSEFLWPFYEAVAKINVPLSVHGVDSGPLLGVERYARFNLDVCLGFPFEVFTAISALVFSGVLDRFPTLKFGFFEVGIGWIPWLLDRLEMAYDARPAARERARRRPKDCFDNFYFSFGSEDSTLPDVVKRFGSARLMIGSDYPHPDGTSPNTISMLQAREGLSGVDIDNLLGNTAADFFGLTPRV